MFRCWSHDLGLQDVELVYGAIVRLEDFVLAGPRLLVVLTVTIIMTGAMLLFRVECDDLGLRVGGV